MNKFKHVDLCCGTGGFSLALQSTNQIDTIYSNDIVEESKIIYEANFNNHNFVLGDLHNIDIKTIPKHNILTSGFPCQPFSLAGQQNGFNDNRSEIFWKIIEIMEYHKPDCVILENVKNIVSHDNGKSFEIIINAIKKLKYNVHYKILNTSDITSIPQNRERIYIVCLLEKYTLPFNLDFPIIPTQPIANILENNALQKYNYTNTSKIYPVLLENIVNENTIYQYRRTYVRENKKGLCHTLTANMGTGGHNVPIIIKNNAIRKLTPRECFNLQGFTNDYVLPVGLSDAKLYKLAGNAITVGVAKLIIERLLSIYENVWIKI